MKMNHILFLLTAAFCFPSITVAKIIEAGSPDKKNVITIETDNQVSYSLSRNGTKILDTCPLSLTVGNDTWGTDKCRKITRKSVSEKVEFIVPRKYKETVDNYNQVELIYKDYKIEFRIYNDGVAYRFVSTANNKQPVKKESVSFRFGQDHTSYTLLTDQLQNWFEQDYTVKPINALPKDSFSVAPVMVEVDKYKVLLAEANLYNYPGMYLQPALESFHGIFANYPDKEVPKPPRERKPRPARPAREESEKRDFAPMVPAETFAPTEPPVIHPEDTPAGRAQKFLMDVTDRMGVKVDVYVDDSKADNLSIHMIGDTLGILIGRRGETLDALQYLTSLQVNKGREGYIRVTLDTENYRAKREDSLRRLAQRMANRAVKTGRKVVLEPMNPYERRVLHTALQNHPAVTTHSEGEEPNRRVVIMLKNQPERPEKSAEKPQGEKPSRSRRSRRRGPRKPVNPAENQTANEPQETVAAPESPAAVDVLGVEE